VDNLVRHLRHHPHFFHVVNPHDVRAVHDGNRDGGRRRVKRFVLGGLGKE
jgi:hypothetical protein